MWDYLFSSIELNAICLKKKPVYLHFCHSFSQTLALCALVTGKTQLKLRVEESKERKKNKKELLNKDNKKRTQTIVILSKKRRRKRRRWKRWIRTEVDATRLLKFTMHVYY